MKKTYFLFNPNLILITNCITSRTENQNINMKNCLISIISSNGDGGAISITSSYSLNINDTTFYQCISTYGNCGSIRFENGLNIQLLRICAVGCHSGDRNNYQFAYLQTTYNQILDLVTINNCSNLNGYYTLQLTNGKQNISNINISYNNNIAISGICNFYPNSMFTNYGTFYKNTVSADRCIYFVANKGAFSQCNIILNNSPTLGVVYISASGIYNLNECIFDQNKNILIALYSGTLQLINCYYLNGSYHNSLIITNTNYYLHSIYLTYYCSYSNPPIQTLYPTNSFDPTINPTNIINPTHHPTLSNSLIYTLNQTISNTLNPTISDSLNPSNHIIEKSNTNLINNSFEIQNNLNYYLMFTYSSIVFLIIILLIAIITFFNKKQNSPSDASI